MARYEKKKRQGLCLYHEDLTILELLPDSDIATIIRHLSAFSQMLANGNDIEVSAPDGLSDMAKRLFVIMADKAERDQAKYEDQARINAENRRRGLLVDDGRPPYDDGRPSESESVSETLSSSSSESSSEPPFLEAPTDRRTDDDDDGEFLDIFNQVSNSGISGGASSMSQLAAWRNEYGLEALKIAVSKAILHGAKSLAYIGTTLANKDKPKPTKEGSYSQRDYSEEDNALPEWQLEAIKKHQEKDTSIKEQFNGYDFL